MNNEINIKLNFNSVNVVDTTKNLNVKILMVKGEKGDPGSLSNNYGTSSEDGYSQDYLNDKLVNVGTSVDTNYITNILRSINLFDKSSGIITPGYYNASDNLITTDATLSCQSIYIKVKPNTNYTISSNTITIYRICEYDINKSFITRQYNGTASISYTITTGNTTEYIRMGGTLTTVLDSLQIEEGSTASTYEPFIQKSINVDNTKFTDTINVGTSINNSDRVNVLFNPNLTPPTTYTSGYRLNGDGTLLNEASYSVSDYIEAKENTDYIFNKDRIQYYNRVCFFDSDKTCIGQNSGTSATFTTPADTKYIRYGWITIELTSLILQEGTSILTPSINIDGEEIYSKPVVLWTNSNPSTTFNAQDINISNLSDFNYYEVSYKIHASQLNYYQTTGKIPRGINTCIGGGYARPNNTPRFYSRYVEYSSTKLTFGNGYYSLNFTDNSNTANDILVPYQIIGYK